MLSLFLSSKTSYRPRLGRKPASRRLSSLALGGCIAALILPAIFADKQQLSLATSQIEATEALKLEQSEALSSDSGATQSLDAPQKTIQKTLKKKNKFRVQMVSYDQVRQQQLQNSLANLQQKQQEIEESQAAFQAASQEEDTSTYLGEVERKIERSGNRRWVASGKRLVGEAEVLVEIAYNGDITNLELVTSSGKALVDSELLQSVREAAPFAIIPLSLRQTGQQSIPMTRWLRFIIEENVKK